MTTPHRYKWRTGPIFMDTLKGHLEKWESEGWEIFTIQPHHDKDRVFVVARKPEGTS